MKSLWLTSVVLLLWVRDGVCTCTEESDYDDSGSGSGGKLVVISW